MRDGDQKTGWGPFVLSFATFPVGAPRKNRRWETRHLVGPIRDVGYAGHRGFVAEGLRRCGLGKPCPDLVCTYRGAAAIALANKTIGQTAMNTIIPKATSSNK